VGDPVTFPDPAREEDVDLQNDTHVVVERVATTDITVVPNVCPRCGNPTEETHTITRTDTSGTRSEAGAVRACRTCDVEHWLFYTHGPHADEWRRLQAKTVV
jgi:hypothetical protein